MRNYFSKREIVFLCIIILLLTLIVYYILVENVKLNIDLANAGFTIITAVICSILAAAIAPRSVQGKNVDKDDLLHEIEEVLATRIQRIVDEKEFAVPTITYHDSDDPNISFDKKLNESISTSKKYVYFSDRALYLPKRLSKMIQTVDNRLHLTIILADVREKSIYDARTELYLQRERALHSKDVTYRMRGIDEIIREEKIAVLKSIYALSKLRDRYNIEIYLHKEIPFLRFEITDTLLILTFLTQLTSGKTYPASVFYENETLFRLNFEDYSKEIINRAYRMKDQDQTIKGLREIAKQANLVGLKDTDITDYYTKIVK